MKVLLVRSGECEHALARVPVHTSNAEHPIQLLVQTGNPDLETLGDSLTFTATEPDEVPAPAKAHSIELVVADPEAPLVAGVVGALMAVDTPHFGPTPDAARLEASKPFAKNVVAEVGVATACSLIHRNVDEVDTVLQKLGAPYVVKDDVLAAEKGVVVTHNMEEARAHAKSYLEHEGGAIVIGDYLDGFEVSPFRPCNGTSIVPLVPTQDFKRADDADSGPNTDGMGAYSSLPWLDEDVVEKIVRPVA